MNNHFIDLRSIIMLDDVCGYGGAQYSDEPLDIKHIHLPRSAQNFWRELPDELMRPIMVTVTPRWIFTLFNNKKHGDRI